MAKYQMRIVLKTTVESESTLTNKELELVKKAKAEEFLDTFNIDQGELESFTLKEVDDQ